MLQCVAVCCSVFQNNTDSIVLESATKTLPAVLQRVAVCCSVLQRVAACCGVLRRVAASCSVLQCVPVCSSVSERTRWSVLLQCDAGVL